MTQVNFCKVGGKEYLARFLILTMMMFMSISFISQKNAFKVAAVTTESDSGSGAGGDINDLDVSMDENGNITIEGIGEQGDTTSTINTFLKKYRNILGGLSGFAFITFGFMFIRYFISLATGATNPQARSSAIHGILFTGVATALSGILLTVMTLFYGAFR